MDRLSCLVPHLTKHRVEVLLVRVHVEDLIQDALDWEPVEAEDVQWHLQEESEVARHLDCHQRSVHQDLHRVDEGPDVHELAAQAEEKERHQQGYST